MKKKGMVAVVAIAVFACLLLCTPALADYNFDGFTVETRASGTVYGGVFIGYEPWASTTTLTGNFEVPDGTIKWARLYTGVWGGNPYNVGWMNVTFNGIYDENGLGPIHLRGEDDTNPNVWCSGCGKYWMWYDVTNLTNAGQTNTAKTWKINGSLDGRVYGIVLVVVYEGGDNPKDIRYWINDGSDALHYFSWVCPECGERNEGTTYFNGAVNKDIVTKANLTVVHLTGYEPGCDSCLKFNDNSLDTSMVDSNTFELNSWDVTSYVNASENNAWYTRCEDWPSCTDEKSDYFVNIATTILVLEKEAVEKPDLNVSGISVNCGYLFGNESNNISATVKNNGTVNASAFNVSFSIDGFSKEVRVDGGLTAGTNTTVCVTDPTLRNAGDSVTLTVTADSNGEVAESDERNNEMTISKTVVNNGYKGKRYTGGDDITTWKMFDLKGDLLYSLGDSYYASGYSGWPTASYTANWTASDLPVPTGATIREARLYVPYCFDYQGDMPDNVSLKFNENAQILEKHYTDRKSHGSWDYPYGMLAYNVTDDFDTSGNIANLTNVNPKCCEQKTVSIRGMLLVVIYADDSELERTIYVNEEFDLLYGGSSKCTAPEEATAYAPFGAIDLSAVENATLITFAPGADGPEGDLLFNGQTWNDVWSYSADTQIGIDERNVAPYLQSTDNEAGFQSSADYMEASNAFLVITYKEAAVPIFDTDTPANPYPSIFGTHNGTITVYQNITVNRMYTYACSGTGGHTEYVKIWNETTGVCAEAHWDGYIGDYHNISFDGTLILKKGVIYNYTIRTGSYPQIHHRDELEVDGGIIRCTKFTDANGKVYYNWIPAIKLY